jgi:hypothetical protein
MDIFSIQNEDDFEAFSIETFRFQAQENETYREYLRLLNIDTSGIMHSSGIPYMPVSFFKSHKIISSKVACNLFFQSSGTGQMIRSTHYVSDPQLYNQSLLEGFKKVYGEPSDYIFLALLPTYMDNPHSSLIYMINQLMLHSGNSLSGFFNKDLKSLAQRIEQCQKENKKIFLWGVTYALLQLSEEMDSGFDCNMLIIETGGMKGHGRELIREELHAILKEKLGTPYIHSEYGMTELLSQAYCTDGKSFRTPPWMKVIIRDPYDPFNLLPSGQNGAINVIDLANRYSCSFIATDDLGKISTDGFEVLGRLDHSEIRGCNLLAF